MHAMQLAHSSRTRTGTVIFMHTILHKTLSYATLTMQALGMVKYTCTHTQVHMCTGCIHAYLLYPSLMKFEGAIKPWYGLQMRDL